MAATDTPPATTQADLLNANKKWRGENPLRKWRLSNDVTIHQAAGMIGCSMTTIQMWEAGAANPNDEFMANLSKIIGPNFPKRWTNWTGANPTA